MRATPWILSAAAAAMAFACTAIDTTEATLSPTDEAPPFELTAAIEEASAELAMIPEPARIPFGQVAVVAFGCAPACGAVDSRSEGWYDSCSNALMAYGRCYGQAAFCDPQGKQGAGWYSTDGSFIAASSCRQHRDGCARASFRFNVEAGQHVDLYADGLYHRAEPPLEGLDAYVLLFKREVDGSHRLIASNDDTAEPGWWIRHNPTPNPRSASLSLDLAEAGRYVLVVGRARARAGSVEVVIKSPDVRFCAVATLDEYAPTYYKYAQEFGSRAEAEAFRESFVSETQRPAQFVVDEGPCRAVGTCVPLPAATPVCGQVLYDEPRAFADPCEFERAVRARAGVDGASKGNYWAGACPSSYCATVTSGPPQRAENLYQAKNLPTYAEAEAWIAAQAGWSSARVFKASCGDTLEACPAEPAVCGSLLGGPNSSSSYAGTCELFNDVRREAGASGQAQASWSEGTCGR